MNKVMGVRACDLTHLMLDDIDWAEGCMRVRPGKSHRERRLPLPYEVGEALCVYLQRERPSTSFRRESGAISVIEGPLKAGLSVKADIVYADTQGQPAVAFASRTCSAST